MPIDPVTTNFGNRVIWVSILASLALLLWIVYLVRRRRLSERYALVWMVVPILFMLFSSSRGLLEGFAALVGIYYAPAVMIPVLLVLYITIGLYSSMKATRTEESIKNLTQEVALLRHKLEQNNRGLATQEGGKEENGDRRYT